MDLTKKVQFVGINESSSIIPKDFPKDDEASIMNDIFHDVLMNPLFKEEPKISYQPNDLIYNGYRKYPYVYFLCEEELDLEEVQKALNFINRELNNIDIAGRASSGTGRTKLIVENFCVIDKCSEKRPFGTPNIEPPNLLGPHYHPSKYQAMARTSDSHNVETPNNSTNTMGVIANNGVSKLGIKFGIEGIYMPNNQGGMDLVGFGEIKNSVVSEHKKFEEREKILLLFRIIQEACNKDPHHVSQEKVAPAAENMTEEHDWNHIEVRSPLKTLAPIEENEDYVDPLLWVGDDLPLELPDTFDFSFVKDDM